MKSAEYERADHQPHRGPVNRPLPSHEELKRACGKTAAVVLATDFGTTPLTVQFENDAREPVTCGKADEGKAGIPRPLQSFEGKAATSIAVEAALTCGFASVMVVAGGNDSERATLERTVRAEVRCVDNAVRFAPFDADKAYRETIRAHGFALYDIPKDVLDYATHALDTAPEADSALFLSCDQVRIPLLICMKYAKRPTGSPHSTSLPRGFNGTGARRFSCRARSLRGLTRPACATFAPAGRTAPCRASL